MINKNPSVEVIILHHNGEKLIDSCLRTLRKTKYNNFKVTVLDQNSSDNSVKIIKKNYPWVNLISSKTNLGFAEANNKIMKSSKSKYVVLLNNDTEQHKNWLSELVKVAESDNQIAAVQPKIRSLSNKEMFEYAGAAGGEIDIYGYPICRGRVYDKIEKDVGQYESQYKIFWSSGAAMLLRLSAAKKVDYLDEDFFAYAEEIDMCWRVNLAGYKIAYAPKAIVYHLGSGSWGSKKLSFKKEYLIHRNHWFILIKNYSLPTLIKIIPVKIILEVLAFLGFIYSKPIKSLAILIANLSLVYNLPTLIKKNRLVKKLRVISDKDLRKIMISQSTAFNRFVLGKK